MVIYMEWNGGSSYAPATMDDRERCESIKEAVETFRRRADFDPHYPCVENPTALLYTSKHGDYPDWELTLGPHKGVRRARC